MGIPFFFFFGDKTKENLEKELAEVIAKIEKLSAEKELLESELAKLED